MAAENAVSRFPVRVGGTFLARGFGAAAFFFAHIIVARALGGFDYGVFAFAAAWLGILGTAAACGLNHSSLRYISQYAATGQLDKLRGFLRWSVIIAIAASTAVAAVGLAIVQTGIAGFSPEYLPALTVAFAGVPLCTALLMFQAYLRALGRTLASEVLDRMVRPAVWLTSFFFLISVFDVVDQGVIAVSALVVSYILSLGAMMALVHAARPSGFVAVKSVYRVREWGSVTWPLALMVGIQLILNRVDIIMLGSLATARDVGIYSAASRLAELALFALQSANIVVAPMISELHAQGDRAQLQQLLGKAARFVAIITLVVAGGLAVFGGVALGLFGPQFEVGHTALSILLAGCVVNALCGPVGYIATMTGLEKLAAVGQFMAAVVNVILNFALIPIYGLAGAAAATSVSMVLWNVILLAVIVKKMGLNPTVVHFRSRKGGFQ